MVKLFDEPSRIEKDPETGQPKIVPKKKGALSVISDVGQAALAPWIDAYNPNAHAVMQSENARLRDEEAQTQAEILNQKAEQDFQKYAFEASMPENQAKQKMAEMTLMALTKAQNGQPLNPLEQSLLKIKDQSNKPDDLAIWRQAEKETLHSLGGSEFVGLSPQRQAEYSQKIKSRYLDLKREMGVESPEDKADRAKGYLSGNGYLANPETIKTFLDQNPNF